jgi:hypothetical protein
VFELFLEATLGLPSLFILFCIGYLCRYYLAVFVISCVTCLLNDLILAAFMSFFILSEGVICSLRKGEMFSLFLGSFIIIGLSLKFSSFFVTTSLRSGAYIISS